MGNEPNIRDVILKAAIENFSKFGYKKTTLNDIAKHIGKGKSALYYYFKNKEEIFAGVLAYEVNLLRDGLMSALDREKTPQAKLRCYIIKRMELYHQLVNFYSAIQTEYLENISVIENVRKQYDQQELEIISEILSTGINSGEFIERDVQLTAYAIILAMKGFEYPFSYEKDLHKIEHDIDQLLDVLFYGIVRRRKS